MRFFQIAVRWSRWIGLAVLAALLTPLNAFPPAPHHEVTGMVRDEYGNPLTDALLIFETESGKQFTAPIIPHLKPDANYRLFVPMDSGIAEDLGSVTAVHPAVRFRVRVQVGNNVQLPIEMRSDFSQLGQPGGVTRLDLTLGEDVDGDGLPDAWERALLAAAHQSGDVSGIRAEDDSDGDGLSNLEEYLAGTYAYDPAYGFDLKLTGTDHGYARLRFLAVRGRTYSILGSADLKEWKPVSFRIEPDLGGAGFMRDYWAIDVRNVEVSVDAPVDSTAFKFFKLMVQ